MVVLVPPCKHTDTGQDCDITTYRRRGWCRVEQVAFALKDYKLGAGRVMMAVVNDVEGTVHPEPATWERLAQNPNKSVFNGDFTCCMRGHKLADGKEIPCDKTALEDVVIQLHNNALDRLKAEGDVLTWRRMLSCKWLLMDGSELPTPRVASVSNFLQKYKISDVTSHVEGAMTALHYAAYENDRNMVNLLLTAKADMEAREVDGMTPLFMCTKTGSSTAAEAFLQAGDDPSRWAGPPKEGEEGYHACYTVVWMSAFFSDPEDGMTELLLKYKADITACSRPIPGFGGKPSWVGLSVLNRAIQGGSRKTVKLLLNARADPSIPVAMGGLYEGLAGRALARDAGVVGLDDLLPEFDPPRTGCLGMLPSPW